MNNQERYNQAAAVNQMGSQLQHYESPPDPRLEPFEEPQPAKNMYLYICELDNARVASGSGCTSVIELRRATADDLAKLGFVRKATE
mgnify:CR=1 FL=1